VFPLEPPTKLGFRITGEAITLFIRHFMENKEPDKALNLLGGIEGLTVDQARDVMNEKAEFYGTDDEGHIFLRYLPTEPQEKR
jgi:hypothetical protein